MDTSEILKSGMIADRYEIIEMLGRGGMSVVYKGRHQLMGRVVAIKMLHSKLLDNQVSIKRFHQEAQAASTLSHPNLITIFDFGIVPGGMPYIVMDFVEGRSLADYLDDDTSLDASRAVPIFVQVCTGLAHAHKKGVLHRDLKPSNIMIALSDDDEEFAKVVDFGIATFLPEAGHGSEKITQAGDFCGSVAYMSPEHCKGKQLDHRSDIYSMGCVMYETLTGLPPFMGENILEAMQMHINDQPKPFKEIRPDLVISERLESIVMKALEKDPNNRQQLMDELRQELQGLVQKPTFDGAASQQIKLSSSDPFADDDDSPSPAATNSVERKSTVSGATPQRPTESGQSFTQNETQTPEPRSDQMSQTQSSARDLRQMVADAQEQKPKSASPVSGMAAGILVLAIAGMGAWYAFMKPSSTPPPTPTTQPTVTTSVATPTPPGGDEVAWQKFMDQGEKAYSDGEFEESEKAYKNALTEAEKFGQKDKHYITSMRRVADIYYVRGRDKEAEDLDKQAEQLEGVTAAEVPAEPNRKNDSKVTERIAKIALDCHKNGQCDTAEVMLRRALEIAETAFGVNSPQAQARREEIATFYMSMGDYDKAQPYLKRVMSKKSSKK